MNIFKNYNEVTNTNDSFIVNADCFDVFNKIESNSIDLILTDPPYGTTACSWDSVLPYNDYIVINNKIYYEGDWYEYAFKNGYKYNDAKYKFDNEKKKGLWTELKRIIKERGVIVMTASQPFTTTLINSNIKMFKYEMIWKKAKPSNFLLGKKQILKMHENILVFYSKQPDKFNPQKVERLIKKKGTNNEKYLKNIEVLGTKRLPIPDCLSDEKLEGSIVDLKTFEYGLHPTQKPIILMEYLIKTYTNENDMVLDFTAGSFSTCVAAKNLNRKFIGIEKEEKYFNIGIERLK